ncbi:DUF4924 family protein [Rhodonellum sp.]|uniref:DUF4924 family protein n=1 Tax=Rhodonellum sp. TaxID=2231180 RepID=UPI002725247E|nr:DUF4924 family protein [Rhodonellum sp.]MDO9550984.1 DUF4924 family protein [Rhodonellum sp.]
MKEVAENKKTKNIGEYIIYMYQMEDLLRAYAFEIADIKQYVIAHYPISEEQKNETYDWFEGLIASMKAEGKLNEGHLEATQESVEALAKIHWELLKSDQTYFDIYTKAKPHVIRMILEAGEKSPKHEIQVCVNGIYGLLLARLRSRDVPKEMLDATIAFGDVLSYLNYSYFESLGKKIREN